MKNKAEECYELTDHNILLSYCQTYSISSTYPFNIEETKREKFGFVHFLFYILLVHHTNPKIIQYVQY